MNPVLIPSKYKNVESMFKACTGYVAKKNESTLATQSSSGVNKTERVDVRVGVIV